MLPINNMFFLNCNFFKKVLLSRQYSELCLQNMKKLEKLFNIKPIFVKEILSKNRKLAEFNTDQLVENYNKYTEVGISKKTLIENPELLTNSNLSSNLTLLSNFDYNINVTAPLLLLSSDKLDKHKSREQIKQKIKYISDLLDVTEAEVCRILSKRPFLVSLSLNHLEESIKVLIGMLISKAIYFM